MTSSRPRPGWSSDIWDEWRRSSLPEQGTEDDGYVPGHHVCGVGGRPKPGHSEYRQCRCGQWYGWGTTRWWPISSPPRKWLRSHGMDAGEFWDYTEDDRHRGFVLEGFFTSRHWLRRFLLMLRRKS